MKFPKSIGLLGRSVGIAVLAAIVGIIAGCGSGGQTADSPTRVKATASAVFTIKWPQRPAGYSRLIPLAANSIDVHLTSADGTVVLGDALLACPSAGGTSTTTFTNMPLGAAILSATAYPNSDGTGTALASAQESLALVAGTTPVALTMASTITALTVSPATSTIIPDQTEALMATATDGSGNIVLTTASAVVWTSSAPIVAAVDASGNVTGRDVNGAATVTATDTESNISGSATVTVSGPPPPPVASSSIYEGFNYSPGQNLTGQNGGTGWGFPWSSHGPGTPSITVAGSLSYMNLLTTGNAYETTSDQPVGDDRDALQQMGTPGQVLYVSTLMRPLDAMNAGSPDTYFSMGIGDVSIGKGGKNPNMDIETNSGNQLVATNVLAQQNTTYFIVVRVTFGMTNNTYDMFVDPIPGGSLPATPDATLVSSATPLYDLHYGSSIRCIFDEMRVGPTYASVSPTD